MFLMTARRQPGHKAAAKARGYRGIVAPPGFLGTPVFQFDHQVNSAANVVNPGATPSAAVDSAGNLYVAWTRSTATLSTEIYVSTSTDGGVTWQPAVRANAPGAAGEDIYPAIVAAPNGTVYVAWTQAWFPFVNITVSQSTNEGNTFSGYTNASGQDPPGYAIYPSLGVDSQGRVYMAYQGLDFFSMTQDANLTWSDDGITWTAPLTISGTAGFGLYPQVLVDHADRVHAFWLDYRGLLLTGALTVWHSMSADRGATWSFGSSISEGAADPTGIISVAAHLDEIVVTWPASSGMANGISSIASADGALRPSRTAWLPAASGPAKWSKPCANFHTCPTRARGKHSWSGPSSSATLPACRSRPGNPPFTRPSPSANSPPAGTCPPPSRPGAA